MNEKLFQNAKFSDKFSLTLYFGNRTEEREEKESEKEKEGDRDRERDVY